MMLEFIKQMLITLMSFLGSLTTKCLSGNNNPIKIRPTLIDLRPDELHQGLDNINTNLFLF